MTPGAVEPVRYRENRRGEIEIETAGGNWQRVETKPKGGILVASLKVRRRVRRAGVAVQEGGES